MDTSRQTPSYELIGRYLASELSPSERLSVEEWIDVSEDNRSEFLKLKQAWEHAESYYILQDIDKQKAKMITWFKVRHAETYYLQKNNNAQRLLSKSLPKVIRYAAIFILFIGLPFALYISTRQNQTNISKFTQVVAPVGSRTSLTLSDGTKVWLNAGSTLRFDNNFNNGHRKIYLEGEAYFDVTKNKKLPFIVKTSDIDLKVLGTAFNVKCYKEEGTIETTLVRGSIMIESKDASGKIETTILKPNEKAIFVRKRERGLEPDLSKIRTEATDITKVKGVKQLQIVTAHIVVKPAEVEEDISWKDGYFLVNNESLEALIIKLSRRYDFSFKFLDQEIKDYRYSGKIKESSLEQMLNALKLTSPIDFEVRQKEVLIRENQQRKKDHINNYHQVSTSN